MKHDDGSGATHPTERSDGKTPAVEVHDLTVAYANQPVLWDVDLSLPEGRLIAIVGPNGAGKSTLLKAILGLVPAVTGWVKVFDQAYEARRSWVGYVPQRESVDWDFPTSALDVVTMGRYGPLGWFRRPGRRQREAALACLDQVGIRHLADRQISQLSGGQQQRVFLARALAQEAQALPDGRAVRRCRRDDRAGDPPPAA